MSKKFTFAPDIGALAPTAVWAPGGTGGGDCELLSENNPAQLNAFRNRNAARRFERGTLPRPERDVNAGRA